MGMDSNTREKNLSSRLARMMGKIPDSFDDSGERIIELHSLIWTEGYSIL
jgi:hypothetical protein